MASKFIVVCALVAVANAGYLGAPATYAPGPNVAAGVAYSSAPAVSHFSYSSPIVSYGQPFAAQAPAITTQHQNILRSYGNLGQVSTYSKTIDTPFSSVSKSDVRVSNPSVTAYAAPALHTTYAAPAVHTAYAAPAIHTAYAAPAIHTAVHAAPAVVRAAPAVHATYAAPAVHTAYAAPAVHAVHAAPAVAAAGHGLLGVAYSAAPVVSHMTYSNGLGINYGW